MLSTGPSSRTIDGVHGGQPRDHQQRVATDPDDAEPGEGHRSAPAGENQLLPRTEAGADEDTHRESAESREQELPVVELADDRTQDGANHSSPQSEGSDRTEPLSRQIVHTSHFSASDRFAHASMMTCREAKVTVNGWNSQPP